MIDFDYKNIEIAKEWILKLFKDKQYFFSGIYQNGEFMKDAIIKYVEDPYAFSLLEKDQFEEVFSSFEDDKILVVHNFPCLLNREHFIKNPSYIQQECMVVEYESNYKYFSKQHPITFTVSKDVFDYKCYLNLHSQLSNVAYIDIKSGRTMIALWELNFLIRP